MSLLDSLSSKPRWQHARPDVRRAAVEELDDVAILYELAVNDDDAEVRTAALSRIPDPDLLDRLCDEPPPGLPDALREQARRQRLAQLLPDGRSLAGVEDAGVLSRVAVLAVEPELMAAAIGAIDDPLARAELAATHPVARARLLAAEGIDDLDVLQALAQRSRHRDKSVYRHCRERLQRHQDEQRCAQERAEALAQLAEDAAALRAAVQGPEFAVRWRQLQQRWEKWGDGADAALGERILADLDVCARRVEEAAAARAAELEQREKAEQAKCEFRVLLDEMQGIAAAAGQADAGQEELVAAINSVEERWVLAQQLAQPSPDQLDAFKSGLKHARGLLHGWRQLQARAADLDKLVAAATHVDNADFAGLQQWVGAARKLDSALSWPQDAELPTPEPLQRLRDSRAAVERRIEALQQREQQNIARVEQALQAFRDELATNHFRNADRALDRLRNLLRLLPSARQAHYQQALRPLQQRLAEIHDWQGFAIEPKKEALVERMKALAASGGDDPDDLAAKVRALQEEWKQLGPLAPARDRALWKAFSAAATEAWAPCKKAFAERSKLRRECYRQRMDVVAQLADYERKVAWPDLDSPDPAAVPPDWARVRETLRVAREAFRELGPVDRKQEHKSQRALDEICNRIYGHIKKEYERNIARKEALLAEAQSLAGQADLKQAIDRAKALQAEWKAAGPVPQKVDRRLWKPFRAACDAVFGRLDEKREERKAAERADAERKQQQRKEKGLRWQSLVERMEACAAGPGQAEAKWDAAGEVPKGIDLDALARWRREGPGDAPEAALRNACIAIEVFADLPSPAADREARMAYQMQRLVDGMGQGAPDEKQALLEMINGMLGLRPSAPWAERFIAAVRTLRVAPGAGRGSSAPAP